MLPIQAGGMFPFYQIGIVSYGAGWRSESNSPISANDLFLSNLYKFSFVYATGCGRPNVPGAYTNVQHFVDWIQMKLNIKP